jgi:hypothetical protein
MAIIDAASGTSPTVARSQLHGWRNVLAISLILILIELIVLWLLSLFQFGSVSAAISYLNGDRLLIHPPKLEFGALRKEGYRTLGLTLENRADYRVRIRGASASAPGSASCSVLRIFPITIGPGEKVTFPVSVQAHNAGTIDEQILLFTDDKRQPTVKVTITGSAADIVDTDPAKEDHLRMQGNEQAKIR